MVNRQDVPYSPGSPKIGRHLLAAKIIFDGTKLAIERSRPKTTTDGRICSFQLFSINRKIRIAPVAVGPSRRERVLLTFADRISEWRQLRDVGH
jgi:hypothetical protein